MRVSSSRRESGFTIVEVMIAALIITMVVAGGVYFVAGSGKSQQKTLVRQKMAAAADDISQRVRADQQWLQENPDCKKRECDVSSSFPVTRAKPNDPKMTAEVIIRPIDGAGDNVGADDLDHVTPDFYRIQIGVELDKSEQAKWGAQPTFETISTVDATALGRAVGSLVVQTCETVNQVDERMSIAGCDGSGVQRQMDRQPSPCASPFPVSQTDWMTPGRRPVLPIGCNNAYDSANDANPYLTSVDLRSVNNVSFKIQRETTDGGPGTTRLSSEADSPASEGTYVFSGLPAGVYRITVTAGNGRETWTTKMVPSKGRASVQANQEARALVVVRPVQGIGTYGMRFTRATWHYKLSTTSATEFEDFVGAGMTVRITTTYTYLIASGPTREVWPGPAWSAWIAMEPKPFDRYRDGSGSVTQPAYGARWDDSKAPNNGWIAFPALPSGLISLPQEQPKPANPPDDTWGDVGTRTQDCDEGLTPGGQCGNFAWIRPNGQANGTVAFHSEDGECYVHSSVAPFAFGVKLQNGGGHADRCSRDFEYINPDTGKSTWIRNFMPDKQGNDGGRMLISMTQTSACVADCEYTSGGGTYSSGYGDPKPGGVSTGDAPLPRASSVDKIPVVRKDPPPDTTTSTGGGSTGGSTGGGAAGGFAPAVGQAAPSSGAGGSPPIGGLFGG